MKSNHMKHLTLVLIAAVIIFSACEDQLKNDSLIHNSNGDRSEIVGMTSSAILIDVLKRNNISGQAQIEVSREPSFGALSPESLAGIFKYQPDAEFLNGFDNFVFEITANGKLYTDSVVVRYTSDTTELDCTVDYFYGLLENATITLVNNTGSLELGINDDVCPDWEIVSANIAIQPRQGDATLSGLELTYSPGNEFEGYDQLVCSISLSNGAEEVEVLTNVYVYTYWCEPYLNDDYVDISNDTAGEAVYVSVLSNDVFCSYGNDVDTLNYSNVTLGISEGPQRGSAQVVNRNGTPHIEYIPSELFNGTDSVVYSTTFAGYELYASLLIHMNTCDGINARDDYYELVYESDSVDLADSLYYYLGPIHNDDLCGYELDRAEILEAPNSGQASFNGEQLIYIREEDYEGEVRMSYVIFTGPEAPILSDTAQVIINIVR